MVVTGDAAGADAVWTGGVGAATGGAGAAAV
jgi:hypothetical protein